MALIAINLVCLNGVADRPREHAHSVYGVVGDGVVGDLVGRDSPAEPDPITEVARDKGSSSVRPDRISQDGIVRGSDVDERDAVSLVRADGVPLSCGHPADRVLRRARGDHDAVAAVGHEGRAVGRQADEVPLDLVAGRRDCGASLEARPLRRDEPNNPIRLRDQEGAIVGIDRGQVAAGSAAGDDDVSGRAAQGDLDDRSAIGVDEELVSEVAGPGSTRVGARPRQMATVPNPRPLFSCSCCSRPPHSR